MTGDKLLQNSPWQGRIAVLLLLFAFIAVPAVALGGTDLLSNTTEPTVGVPDEMPPGVGTEENDTPEPTPTETVAEEVTPEPTEPLPESVYIDEDIANLGAGTVIPSNKDVLLRISNDGNARFNDYGNNTYHFFSPGQSATQGMNALHITTDPEESLGQVTFSSDQAGVFYLTDTGGRGWDDDGILMLAVNGTTPDSFRVTVKASGYQWTPVLTGTYPTFGDITYVPEALNETFTKDDFLYGPQIWRPCAAANFPIFDGQDMTDTGNTFSILFIDLNAGILGANALSQPSFAGQSVTDNGAIKVEYSFENLPTFAAFDAYAYTVSSNQGQGIRWTNRLSASGSSGYAFIGQPLPEVPTANFTANVTSGEAPLAVQFTDLSTNAPTAWAWDFGDGATSTEQNSVHTYTAAGTYSVNLTVTNTGGRSDSLVRPDYISVTLSGDGSLLADSAWPKRSHDSANSGQSPYNGPQTNTTKWITQLVSSTFQDSITDASITHAGPVIGPDGIIYLGTRDDNLYAVYPNGTIMWTFTTGGDIYGTAAVCSDGTVYIGSADDNLYAINPDGTEKWRFSADDDVFSSPAIGSDGTVYFGSRDNYVYALNPDGSLKWSYNTGSKIEPSPAIGSDGTIYIGTRYNGLYALNPDGSLKWVYATDGNVYNSPAIGSDGTIYIGTLVTSSGGGKILYAINPDGSLKWKYNAGLSLYYSSPVIGPDDTIFVASTLRTNAYEIGMLHAVAPDGTLEWTCTLEREGVVDNQIIGTPAVGADGTIYIGGFNEGIGSGAIYAVNRDGSIKWWYTFENQAKGTPSIGSDGTLYYGAGDGYLYAFENVVDFTTDVTEGMSTLNVQFTGTSTRDITSWSWDFGDGTTSAEQNPSHTYSTGSTESYTVSLTVTDTAGTSYTAEKPGYITVWNQPVAAFDADLAAGQVPMTVNFTDTSANTPTSWLWDFGDGSTSTDQNPQHTYLTSGTFSVSLTVENPAGTGTVMKESFITADAQPLPVPDFNCSVTSGTVPLEVAFNDLTSGSVNSWYWDFGDGTNSTEQNPVHTYAAQGTYSVGLTVTNYGGSNSTTKEDYILVTAQSLPVTAFNASTTSGQAPLSVTFTDESTGAPFISWFWEFGDGTNSTEQNPVHTYTVHGTYDVELTTTNYEGSNTTLKTDYIVVSLQDPPVASFTTNTTSGSTPLYVAFTDTSTGYNITSWFWEFGDGTNSTEQNPVHVYSDGGTFTVSVTVTNDNGSNTAIKTNLISVSDLHPPTADFSANKTAGKYPLAVLFHDESTSTPKEWLWEFGDGTNSTEQNPIHIYSEIGVYTVMLTVSNDDGVDSMVKDSYITATEAAEPLPNYNDIFVTVANDAGVKYNDIGNNTYHILFAGVGRGLNALHISTDPAENSGQVTVSENKSGTFYATDSGGKGYEDEIILMVAVNGTIPEDFRLHITADGYTWTPDPDGNSPDLSSVVYQPVSLDETFTIDDFIYGPHIWKPSGNGLDFPIYCGQNMSETKNTFQIMFIDLNAGVLGKYASLENMGAVRVNYTFENLNTFAAFNVYGYCQNANSGEMRIAWTNHVVSSGYTVITEGLPVANYSADITYGVAPFTVQFTDTSTGGAPVSWAWDFDNDGIIDSTDQNPTHTYINAGVYSVNLTVTTSEDESDSLVKANYISVASAEGSLLADSAWPKFGYDAANTGQSPSTGSQSNTTKWQYYTNGGAFTSTSPVSGSDGTIYILAEDSTLHAIYPNGTLKWQISPGSGICEGSAAVGADGTIYFGSRDANLYAVNPDGTLKWTYTTVGRIGGSPAIGADGTIYVGGWYEFYALNPDGSLKWNYTTERFFQCCPVLGSDGTVYIGDNGGTVYAFNHDGSLKWSYTTGGAIRGAPAMSADGTLYIGSDDSKVYSFNTDGTLKWTYAAKGKLQGSVAIGTDGSIYTGDRDGRLYALNPDGTLKWSYTAGDNIRGSPAIGADGTAYIGSDDDAIYAINSDGSLKWSYSTGSDIRGSPSIGADGTVYVGSRDKYLYAFEGTLNLTANQTNGTAPFPVEFTGTSVVTPVSWYWDFGDGGTSTEQNATHIYTVAGTYSVSLTVTDSNGSNRLVRTDYITVTSGGSGSDAPVANFTATPTSGEAPLAVQFTDLSTGDPTSWAWDFENDGTVDSNERNATFTYASAGTYTVNLTVANDGGSNSVVKTDYITVTEPTGPSVLPDYNNIFVKVANDLGTKYNAFGNETYNIRFEGIGRGLNALHISTDPAVNFGQVTVSENQSGTFYATDSGGKGYEDEIILMVAVNGTIPDDFRLRIRADGYTWTPNPASNQPPSLDNVTYQAGSLDEVFTKDDFIYGPQIWKPTGNEADYPIYADQNMTDTENTFHLMFVDLNAGVLRPNTDLENRGAVRINYAFENLESFAAFSVYGYCKISNNGNEMVAWTNALTSDKAMSGYSVTGVPYTPPSAPVADFTATPLSGEAPLAVAFTDASTGTPASWAWDFENDGVVDSIEQNPVHVYDTVGTYTVNLTVVNAAGSNTTVKTDYITVSNGGSGGDAPIANFTANMTSGDAPLAVAFTDLSTNTPTSWAWDFENDGVVDSTEQNPVHTYVAAGTYTVNLTVTNDAGSNSAAKTGYIVVSEPSIPQPASIVVTPPTAELLVGATQAFAATVYDTDGGVMDDVTVTWTSSNETVGTLNTAGLFTARAPGTTTVTAAYANVAGTAVVTVTRPQGDQTQNAPLDIPGCNVTTGNDGKPQVSINTTATNATVSGNTIRIVEGNFTLTIETEGAPTNESGTLNGTIANITLDTQPVVTELDSVGTVSASVSANLTGLPAGAGLTTTVSQNVSADAQSAFQLAATADGLNLGDVAYTLNIVRTNLENGQDIAGATIRMAVSPAWVTAHGGVDAIRIIRSAEDGTREVLATTLVGTDADGNMVFEAVSPNGLSVFGLAAATAASQPTGSSSSSGGSSGTSTSVGAASNLKADESATLAMDTTAVSAVTLTANTEIKDLMVTVARGSLPQGAEPPAGTVYQYVQATLYKAAEVDFSSVQLRLAVPTTWLAENGCTADQVTLFRYADGAWQAVPVEALGEENGNAVFSAAANGFGLFAIAATEPAPGTAGDVTPQPTATGSPVQAEAAAQTAGSTPTPQASPLPVWVAILAFGFLLFVRRT